MGCGLNPVMIGHSIPKSSYPPSKGRSRYPRWTMRDGTKVRLEDMTNSHLRNSIALLERKAQECFPDAVSSGYELLSYLQGEMAIEYVEGDLDRLEKKGWEGMLPEAYYHMGEELERREREAKS
jgi:hypothetical protein